MLITIRYYAAIELVNAALHLFLHQLQLLTLHCDAHTLILSVVHCAVFFRSLCVDRSVGWFIFRWELCVLFIVTREHFHLFIAITDYDI